MKIIFQTQNEIQVIIRIELDSTLSDFVPEVSIVKNSKPGEVFIPEKVSSLFSGDNRYGRGNYPTNYVSHSRQSPQH